MLKLGPFCENADAAMQGLRKAVDASIRAALLLLAAAALGGCTAAGVEPLGDGRFAIDCSGGAPSWSPCLAAAERACGSTDYEIVSQVTNEGSAHVGSNDWSTQGSSITRTMIVRCRSEGADL